VSRNSSYDRRHGERDDRASAKEHAGSGNSEACHPRQVDEQQRPTQSAAKRVDRKREDESSMRSEPGQP
jgi:hypothetical protein